MQKQCSSFHFVTNQIMMSVGKSGCKSNFCIAYKQCCLALYMYVKDGTCILQLSGAGFVTD